MNLNSDLSIRVVLRAEELPWQASPAAGVFRRMLEREGEEGTRATSLVRYEPGANFPCHAHPQGEEILVLEGELSDEHGAYPCGTYIKNPPGSKHSPSSVTGCTLLVKLRHLDGRDLQRVVVRTDSRQWLPGMAVGLHVVSLDQFDTTYTALVRWAAGTTFNRHHHLGGEEIFVLQGTFQDEFGSYPCGTWIRNPHMSSHRPFSELGCLIFVKVGHLL